MNSVKALTIYLTCVFIGGSLIAPWLYIAVQWLAEHSIVFPEFWNDLARRPFDRFVRRSFYVIALLALVPLLRSIGFRSIQQAGWFPLNREWKKMGPGWMIGFFSLAAAAAISIASEAVEWNRTKTAGDHFEMMGRAMCSAVLIALLEEMLFRGVLFGGLRKSLAVGPAIVFSTGIFSALHFLERVDAPETIGPATGLICFAQMLRGLINFEQFVPGFLNLMLAGIILAWAYVKTGNLWLSVGLHMGWIFWLKSYRNLVVEMPGANLWIWGTRKLYDGWISMGVLLFAGWLVWFWLRRRSTTSETERERQLSYPG
jgi:membrane protease YdiL (CAAX protease family)